MQADIKTRIDACMVDLVRSKRLLRSAALWTKALAAVSGLLLLPLLAAGAAGMLSLLARARAIETEALVAIAADRNAAAGECAATTAAGDPSISISLSFSHGLLLAAFAGHVGCRHGDHGRHEVLGQLVGSAFGAAKRRKGLAAGKAIGFDVGAGLVQLRRGKGIFDFVALALVTQALRGARLQTALRGRLGAVDAAQTGAGAVGTDLVPVCVVKLVQGLGCLAALAGALASR